MWNKQNWSNIWIWIHEKLSNTEAELKTCVAYKKKRVNRFTFTDMTSGIWFTWTNIANTNRFTLLVQPDLLEQTRRVEKGLVARTWLVQTALLEPTESWTVILQGKGQKSLSLKLKSAAWLSNFDDIDTISVVLLFGLMTLTIDSDSLIFPCSITSKLLT